MLYDGQGQMTQRDKKDASGLLLSHELWSISHDGGKTVAYTNPLGGVTTYKYTDAGKPQEQDNPDSSKLFWSYDSNGDGRLATEVHANGSVSSYTYNDAVRQVVQNLRDKMGSPLSTQSQTKDSRGNVIQSVDPDGFVTTGVYDGLNRLKTMTGPPSANGSARQQMTYNYDAAGITKIATNALGEATKTTFDAVGRPILVEVRSGAGQLCPPKKLRILARL